MIEVADAVEVLIVATKSGRWTTDVLEVLIDTTKGGRWTTGALAVLIECRWTLGGIEVSMTVPPTIGQWDTVSDAAQISNKRPRDQTILVDLLFCRPITKESLNATVAIWLPAIVTALLITDMTLVLKTAETDSLLFRERLRGKKHLSMVLPRWAVDGAGRSLHGWKIHYPMDRQMHQLSHHQRCNHRHRYQHRTWEQLHSVVGEEERFLRGWRKNKPIMDLQG